MSPSNQYEAAPSPEMPDPRLQMVSKDKSVLWYTTTFPGLTKDKQDLLGNYSHVKPDLIIPHLLAIRDKAWNIHPFPCIGQFRFIDLTLSRSTCYPDILHLLKTGGGKLLDLGCGFGQDLRKLVYDGAPPSSLFGAELRSEFVDLGYELFLDKDTLGVQLLTADIFDADSDSKVLDGQMDIVHIGLFLHLFDWEGQRKACERIVGLLKSEKGVRVLGQQVGSLVARDVRSGVEKMVLRHDLESFERLWREVGERTGSRWTVRARLDEELGIREGRRVWDNEETRRLVFEIERGS